MKLQPFAAEHRRAGKAVLDIVLVLAILAALAYRAGLIPGLGSAPDGAPAPDPPVAETADSSETAAAAAKPREIALFDGKTLNNWEVTDFGGQGPVEVKDGQLILGFGEVLTGVTWKGDELIRDNYEIEIEAMRVDGSDFFCGLTFPVGDEPCSLIVGGWGGGVIGLSSIDGFDASENETTQYEQLKEKVWYNIRLRVSPEKIEAWLDDKQIVGLERKDRKFSTRIEVELSEPLGVASFQTTAAIRKFVQRPLGETAVEEEADD
jgi:hypothetical protein